METRWEWHVHSVHLRILQKGLVRAVNFSREREAVGGGECGGLVAGAAGDGAYGGVGGEIDGAGDLPGYVGAANNADLDKSFRHFRSMSGEETSDVRQKKK